MKKSTTGVLLGGVFMLLFLGMFFYRTHKTLAPNLTPGTVASTTTTDLGNGVTVTGTAGAKVTIVPVSTSAKIPAPDLTHKVAYAATLPPEVVAILTTKIATAVASLQKNGTQGALWLQLAVDYKMAGDYKASEGVWVYLTKVSPTSPIAFQDLGDLYQNFVKDYPKSEANYLAALTLDPKNIDLYRNLYTLYKYQYKTNTTAAVDIVAKGLKANPGNPDLLLLQKQL